MPNQLPVVDCAGCGVCCFHMGYPAFVIPQPPLTDEQIDADPHWRQRVARQPELRARLHAGWAGESYWESLPDDLRQQWLMHVRQYRLPDYTDQVESFDGPCIWLDLETRQCRHHEHRPQICRSFEVGSADCRAWRRHYQDRIQTPDQ